MLIIPQKNNTIQGPYVPLFPHELVDIIYCDCPWPYKSDRLAGGKPDRHYPTMRLEDLCDLPVQRIAKPNCVLLMWVTAPLVPEAFIVAEAWGFPREKFRTIVFVWDKQISTRGTITNGQTEYVFCFRQGTIPKKEDNTIRQFASIRKGEHSAKPPYFRDQIRKIWPNQERIELFYRKPTGFDFGEEQRKPGKPWRTWGLEAEERLKETAAI